MNRFKLYTGIKEVYYSKRDISGRKISLIKEYSEIIKFKPKNCNSISA